MPSKTQKQRRYLYWKKGEKWVKKHHFDKIQSAGPTAFGPGAARGNRIHK